MIERISKKAEYGNWISARLLYIPGALVVLFGFLSFFLPLLAVVAVVFFLGFVYFAYAWYRFSSPGGNIQARIQDLVIDHLDWSGEGKALDIGCGNASLTIKIAKKFPKAEVSGIDYWGRGWGYSKSACEKNADIEGVAERVAFQKASASSLPFEDETFDAAASNLVFHEVRDLKDKRDVVMEALRVVRKGGRFAFQDLFLWKRVYGEVADLLETLKTRGIERVEFVDTSDSNFIPKALKLPFMLGKIGILHGIK